MMRDGEGAELREGYLITVEGRPLHSGWAYASMRDCVVVPVRAATAKAVAA